MPDTLLESDIVPDQVKSIRIFLSYSNKDKNLVGFLKAYLRMYGFEVFMAHEDIEPSLEWREVILQELKSTDIFIPVITESFFLSKWTDQETGIGIANDKLIVPVCAKGLSPYGFIDKYQACKLRVENHDVLQESVYEIVKAISTRKPFAAALLDLIIDRLSSVGSYDNAARLLGVLNKSQLSVVQINKLVKSAANNRQVYESSRARPYLENFCKNYKDVISENSLIELTTKLNLLLFWGDYFLILLMWLVTSK